MAKSIPKKDLRAIEDILKGHPEGVSLKFVSDALGDKIPRRTLQYRLRHLVDEERVVAQGERRGVKYCLQAATEAAKPADEALADAKILPLSYEGKDIQQTVSQSLIARRIVGYNRTFLDAYRPNESAYLSPEERDHLHAIGAVPIGTQPAGT